MVDPRMPSLVAIRAFEAAARLGSFAKAAQELDTSAASVSYHVRRLEEQIGVRLFVRHAQKVALTPSGEVVSREASKAFAALRASFIRAVDADRTQLSLTTLPSLGTSWLTPRLGKFRAHHPDLALELDLSADAQDLTAGRFDDPRAPLSVPLLGRPDWWRLWYGARGFAGVDLPGKFGTHLSAEYLDIAAAVAGHGIAIGSPILFRAELESGKLVPAHDFVASDGRSFWFVYPVARQNSAKIVMFREWLCEEAAVDRRAARRFLRDTVTLSAQVL